MAFGASQANQHDLDQRKLPVLPDELVDRQRLGAAIARREPDPAGRRVAQAAEPGLSVKVLAAHNWNITRTREARRVAV